MNIKVHIFWEGHKILRNLHQLFVLCKYCQSNWWRFCKILWPSQNMWTSKKKHEDRKRPNLILDSCPETEISTVQISFFCQKCKIENPWNGNAPAVFMKRKWDVKSEILLNSLCALLGASWLAESVHNVGTSFLQVPSYFYPLPFLLDNLQTSISLISQSYTSHYLVPKYSKHWPGSLKRLWP